MNPKKYQDKFLNKTRAESMKESLKTYLNEFPKGSRRNAQEIPWYSQRKFQEKSLKNLGQNPSKIPEWISEVKSFEKEKKK